MLPSFLFAFMLPLHAGPPADDARRIAAILDYVAADYGGAVANGQITSADEYAEQVGFLQDAAALAVELPPSAMNVPGAVAALRVQVDQRAPPDQVREDALRARREVMGAYGVVLAPNAPLSRESGERLYAQQCAACHGATGGADTPTAAQLTPPPRNFRDPDVMDALSPARAYNGVTDGVKGTAMPSFAQIPASDRWNLAYYLFTLRHDAASEARGSRLAESGKVAEMSPAALAAVGDAALAPGLTDGAHDDAVAWLRGVAPYGEARISLADARDGLDRALVALRAGDREQARRLAGEAYLASFEPHEASLRQASPELVARVEEAFLSVRSRIDQGATVDEVQAEVLRAQALLDDAESLLSGARGARVAFLGALLVILREGLEAALLLMLLLGFASRESASAARQVHLGWLAALGLGVATWFASGWLIGLAGSRREMIEGAVTLLAAGVMVTAHHWLVSAADGRRRVASIRGALGGELGRWTLSLLAFGAVYREAFEVVLFLQAIVLDGGTGTTPVLMGVGVGAVLLIGLVVALLRLGRRVQPGPVLKWAGVLLCAMAVVFVGKGLRSLQEAGVVPIHALGAIRIDVLGVFPTVETTAAQVVLLLGLLASAWWPRSPERNGEAGGRIAAG